MAFGRLLADVFGPEDAFAEEAPQLARDTSMEDYLARRLGRRLAPVDEGLTEAAKSGSRNDGSYLALAARLGLPIAGSVLGALSPLPGGAYAGGALGASAGEALGEYIDGQPLDPQEIGLQGAVGAVPFVGKASSVAGGLLLRGAEGAALGAGSELAREALHGKDPNAESVGWSALGGGLLGALGGAIEGKLASRAAEHAQAGAFAVEQMAQQRAAQGEAADQAYHQATEQILGQLEPADRAMYDAYREGRIQLTRPGPDGQPTPIDPELFARLESARTLHDEATQAWEATKGWLPEQQGAARAQDALADAPPEQAQQAATEAYQQGADEAAQAQQRRRVVTDRTPGDDAADALFQQGDHARRVAADARTMAQLTEDVPTLGQLGLPAPGEDAAGILSADHPDRLPPSVMANVEGPADLHALMDHLTMENRITLGNARRGTRSRAETEAAAAPIVAELAQRLGTNPDTFVAGLRQRGEAVNPEQMTALKTIFTSVVGDFYDATKHAAENPGDPEALATVAKTMHLARGVLEQKAGAVAETGRTMQVLKGTQPLARLQEEAFSTLLDKGQTTPEHLQAIADLASKLDITDPNALTQFTLNATKAKTSDQVYEAWINGLLSGPTTQITNNVSNALALGLRLPEQALAATVDALKATVTGSRRQRFFGEVTADAMGLARGIPGGVRAALRAFDTELPQAGSSTKLDFRPSIAGTKGRVIRTPGRMLMAADEMWKGIGLEGAVHALAYREAAQAGLTGEARLAKMTELLSTDRARLYDAAEPEMLYRTFQKDSPIADAVGGLRQIPGVRYVLPFVRIAANLTSFGLERTPFGLAPLIAKATKGTLAEGEGVDRTARMLLGTGMASAAYLLAANGKLSGAGPTNPGEVSALRATGWTPYSLRIGDTNLDLSRLEPVASMLAFGADAYDASHDPLTAPEDVATRMAFAFAHRTLDQTFLAGLRDVLDATNDDRKATAYLKRFATTAIPNVAKQVTRALDPTVRQQKTLGDRFSASLPGFSEGVLPLRNIWGDPVQNGNRGMTALLSPIRTQTIATDPASREVARLVPAVGLALKGPSPTMSEKGVRSVLDPQDYDQLSVRAGSLAKALVTKLVTSPGYQRMTDDNRKADLIESTVKRARTQARNELKTALSLRKRR